MSDLVVSGVGSVVPSISAGYCTLDQLSDYLEGVNSSATYNNMKVLAINAASRAIDAFCGRRFWLDPTPVDRTFPPSRGNRVDVDDIGDPAGVVVAVDASGDGSFEQVWDPADYQLTPPNAPYASPEPAPYTRVVGVRRHFGYIGDAAWGRLDRIQVTARWGWPAVPTLVTQACIIKAGRIYHRRNSPQGIAAFDEFGPVRISRAEDGDVASMLDDYVRRPVLMA